MAEHSNCKAPQEIQEGDLAAYLNGVASPAVREHIARCPAHRRELADLLAIDGAVDAALFRAGCPAPDMLLLYQAGFLDRADAESVRTHLDSCSHCQAEVGELLAVLETSRAQESTSLLEQVLQAGKQVLHAILVSGSARPAGLAVRGDESLQRQYRADDYQILLSVVPPIAAENRWQIEGQVLELDRPLAGRPGDSVHLLDRIGDPVALDVVDDFGYFVIEGVPSNRYQLHINLFGTLIVIEDLNVA